MTEQKRKNSAAKTASGRKKQAKQGCDCKKTATESACDCALSDYDIASDVLGSQKALIKLYTTSLCEIDCRRLRDLVGTQLSEAAEEQLDVFLYMNDRGMYKTENATLQKVKAARSRFDKCTCKNP